jgi:hypothetical protein
MTGAGIAGGALIGNIVADGAATGAAGFTIGTAPGGVHPVATRVAGACEGVCTDGETRACDDGAYDTFVTTGGTGMTVFVGSPITTDAGFAAATAAIARGFVNGMTLAGVDDDSMRTLFALVIDGIVASPRGGARLTSTSVRSGSGRSCCSAVPWRLL